MGRLPVDGWHKVKAHTTVKEAPATTQEIDEWLNDYADRKAKDSLEWHGIHETMEEEYKTAAARARALLHEMGANLAAHPKPSENNIEYRKPPGMGRQLKAKVQQPHQWYYTVRETWKCKQCWREKKTWDSEQNYKPCGNVTATMRRLGQMADCHSLTAALINGGPEVLIWCRVCGGSAECYAKMLAKDKCKATPWTKRMLCKMAGGLHPQRHATLSGHWALTGGHGTQHTQPHANESA